MKVKSFLLLALLSSVFTLINGFIFQWHVEPVLDALYKSSLSFLLNFFFWGSVAWRPGLLKPVLFVLMALSVFLIYTCSAYQISPLVNSIRLALQTDLKEVKELLSWTVVLPVLILFILGLALKKLKGFKIDGCYSLMMSLLFVFSLMGISSWKGASQIGTHLADLETVLSFLPFNFVSDGLMELKRELKVGKKHHLEGALFHLQQNQDNLLVVLVIGESARFDRFHLNGYALNTSPNLERVDHLVSLTNYYALDTYTLGALPYLFKRSNDRQFVDEQETSFVSVLKQLGFKTYYFSMQTDMRSELYGFAVEHDYYVLGNKMRHLTHQGQFYDEDLLPTLQKITQEKGHRFIVLHTMGSHCQYRDRTPKRFYSKKLSDYDNSIKYTDKVLSEVIELVKDSNALVIYSSDHGESLEGDKVRLHAYPYAHAMRQAPEQLHIPSFWYFSQQFLSDSQNLASYQQLVSNRKKRSDQSFIYHSLLGCIGVQSAIIQPEKNLCAKA